MRKMIDLSHHNTVTDWEEVKKACDLLCIRIGFGKTGKDRKFEEHVKGARLFEIPYGLYIYSYAENEQDSAYEMQRLLDLAELDKKNVRFIAFDREEKKQNISLNTWVVRGAMNEYKKSESFIPFLLYMDQNYFFNFSDTFRGEIEETCYKWIARYNKIAPETLCDAWQFTSKLAIKNNPDVFDCSYLTKALYEKIIVPVYQDTDLYKDKVERIRKIIEE